MKNAFKSILTSALFIVLSFVVQAQITNAVRGQVIEKITGQSLPGATVLIIDSDPLIGTTTDMDGYFEISNVPVGRVSIQISFLGYETVVLQDQFLTGSKALNLNVNMVESVASLKAVEIVAEENKRETVNKMATVSARTFSVEEAERFAGARADVARMASNYAGVRGANDATNDIVIRGNSSNGLLWRMNGVDIPNPNHFGNLGATGGPVSMLNSNVLRNSDFMTAAFPAEYGNATSGVFDLTMRNGNANEHEFLGQVGFNGFELGAEGPISKKSRASYLVNARYSTLDAMQKLGMSVGTGSAVPEYQDVTFNLNFPSKVGAFQLFGIAGNSAIDLLGSEADTTDGSILYGTDNLDIIDRNQMAVVGLNYKKTLGANAYSSFTLAYTYFNAKNNVDTVNVLTREACNCDWFFERERNDKVFAHWFVSKKFSAKSNVKVGVIANQMMFDFYSKVRVSETEYDTTSNANGATQLLQLYAQWQWKPRNRWIVNTGIHGAYLALNNSWSVEPRVGARLNLAPNQNLNFGYGLHSKMQPMGLLFNEKRDSEGALSEVNRNLGFTKSHHFVLGYDWSLPANWRLKSEVYYQHVFDAPVSKIDPNVSYINFPSIPSDFSDDIEHFKNAGKGRNYGLEVTIEKFMTKGFYLLATSSVYKSQYEGAGNGWKSSAWDAGYVVNGLAGKEFALNKNKVDKKVDLRLVFDVKGTYAGGQPAVPIDLDASKLAGEAVYDLTNGYSDKLKDYMRLDANVGFKMLTKKFTQEFTVIAQNVTNKQNPFFERYDAVSQKVQVVNQLGLFVVPTYRITF